ncbi:MAG: MraY family glycosyltransferase [Henriciella sp.]
MSWTVLIAPAGFFAISFAAGLFACALVKRLGVVDAPDGGRKTQAQPVPRLGGVAILLGTLIGMALSFIILMLGYGIDPVSTLVELLGSAAKTNTNLGIAIAFVAISFAIGLWDDIWTANTKLKLAILMASAVGAAALGLSVAAFQTPFGDLTLPVLLIIGSAAWLIVMVNAVNFMDGSNGLAMGSLAIMLAALAAITATSGTWTAAIWWFPLLGAMCAFLLNNIRGQIYAGDAGALGFGALFAALGLASGLNVWTITTIALPFLVDVLLTLIWRAKHGRNWLEAHLDHAYQRLIASGWSHLDAAIFYWGLSATTGGMAYIAALAGGAAPFAVFWGLWIALSIIWVRHRRSAQLSDLSG